MQLPRNGFAALFQTFTRLILAVSVVCVIQTPRVIAFHKEPFAAIVAQSLTSLRVPMTHAMSAPDVAQPLSYVHIWEARLSFREPD